MKNLLFKGPLAHLCWIGGLLAVGCLVIVTLGNAQGTFNQPGNVLITDQFNNRVIEIDPSGNIVWQFGLGPGNTTPSSIIGTNDAERVGTLTLMSGTGIPPPQSLTARRAVPITACSSSISVATSSGNTASLALRDPGSTSSIRRCRTPICISRAETTMY